MVVARSDDDDGDGVWRGLGTVQKRERPLLLRYGQEVARPGRRSFAMAGWAVGAAVVCLEPGRLVEAARCFRVGGATVIACWLAGGILGLKGETGWFLARRPALEILMSRRQLSRGRHVSLVDLVVLISPNQRAPFAVSIKLAASMPHF